METTFGPKGSAKGSTTARCRSCKWTRKEKPRFAGTFVEPSSGLEPETPSLPSSKEGGNAGKRGNPRTRTSRKRPKTIDDD
jgi:hypothetical protein